ncbi:MAG: hypothetical protein KIT73_18940, partial [Burkholderiales bacterium]|nr:hypothetical protein [Burkholderiales bacterium]
FAPGTAARAAVGAVVNGARYVKAGLHGVRTEAEAVEVMAAVRRACKEHDPTITVVAAGYADYRRFEGLSPATVVAAAAHARCDVVMLDTAFKDGPGLFDALTTAELDAFVTSAHAAGLHVALAGAIGFDQVAALRTLGVDIVGVRGCVCRNGDRGAAIDADRVRQLVRVCVGD